MNILKALSAGIFLSACILTNVANAALIDRGSGMIYDDVLDITWLDTSLPFEYARDVNADNPIFTGPGTLHYYLKNLNVGGFNDWRLPWASRSNKDNILHTCDPSLSTSTCLIEDIYIQNDFLTFSEDPRDNELAYMFYINFNYKGQRETGEQFDLDNPNIFDPDSDSGCLQANPPASCFPEDVLNYTNISMFDHGGQQPKFFTGNQTTNGFVTNDTIIATLFHTNGRVAEIFAVETQFPHQGLVWAVRDGDVIGASHDAPEPATLAIFALGLAGMGVMRRRRRVAA